MVIITIFLTGFIMLFPTNKSDNHVKEKAQNLSQSKAEVWISTQSGDQKLSKKGDIFFKELSKESAIGSFVQINTDETLQTIDGMGSSLEPATCYNLAQLLPVERENTLKALLTSDQGIGMNLMRICMGTPDFTGDAWYSYCDVEVGQTDTLLNHFSIEKDKKYIIPVLQEALRINPQLRLFASPWSPPAWMKSSGILTGGHLKPEFYAVYARYFVKFVQAYAAEGIPVFAVTVQNEPGVDREHDVPKWHYPSCHWTAEEQRNFIKNHLGPEFERNGIKTEIWCYDHNYNIKPQTDDSPVFVPEMPGDAGIGFPRTILSDPESRKYTKAMAFHGYVGEPDGMSVIQDEFPKVPVRFTEGSVFGLKGGIELMQILKNRAVSYNGWVTMLDQNRKPNNGPFKAGRTIIERGTANNKTVFHFDYYLYGHFMKFIKPGSIVVSSKGGTEMSHFACKDPDGFIILILINNRDKEQKVNILCNQQEAGFRMPANSIATLRWK
jgi:glucosylceramidase